MPSSEDLYRTPAPGSPTPQELEKSLTGDGDPIRAQVTYGIGEDVDVARIRLASASVAIKAGIFNLQALDDVRDSMRLLDGVQRAIALKLQQQGTPARGRPVKTFQMKVGS